MFLPLSSSSSPAERRYVRRSRFLPPFPSLLAATATLLAGVPSSPSPLMSSCSSCWTALAFSCLLSAASLSKPRREGPLAVVFLECAFAFFGTYRPPWKASSSIFPPVSYAWCGQGLGIGCGGTFKFFEQLFRSAGLVNSWLTGRPFVAGIIVAITTETDRLTDRPPPRAHAL